jgi:hypothetical protein
MMGNAPMWARTVFAESTKGLIRRPSRGQRQPLTKWRPDGQLEYSVRLMFCLRILFCSVVRFSPSRSAAPPLPEI